MKNLQEKLEEIKAIGSYSVQLFFGEDMGCDDSEISMNDRNIQITFSPVGVLGGARILFKGSLIDFLNFDVKTKPIKISNPPKRKEYENGGYFIWGSDENVKRILTEPYHGKWNE